VVAAFGLYLMATASGNMLLFAALLFGIGVCYFWPTMIGFVAENIPKSGAVGLNLMGGAGMFAVFVYTYFMGGVYDGIIQKNLPDGADIKIYQAASATPEQAAAFASAKLVAGPEVIKTTLIIPILLIVAFAGLVFYMRKKKTA
jgi:hypothetical protein